MAVPRIKSLLDKLHTPAWLFWLLVAVLILRIPSFFEPYSYGDEMIYLALGEAIRQRIPLYSGIHDNKPPLLYITAAIAGSLFWFKAILAVWHLVTVFIFWKLSEILFPKKVRLQKIATFIFALLTTIPLLEGNIANAELFMLGPTLLAFIVLLTKKLNIKNLFCAGVLFSIATMFKVPAAFDMVAVVFYWLVTTKLSKVNILKIAKNTIILGLGFVIPIAITIVYYYFRGAFSEYIIAAYLQNVGYLSSFRPGDVQEPFLTKNGPLLIRAVIVGLISFMLFLYRKKLSKQFILITLWLVFSLFAVALSERPYPHYLVQSVPTISLLLAILFTFKTFQQTLAILPLTLAFLVPVYFRFWYYPTAPYYTKFVRFATKQISKDEYFSTFGGNVLRNYKISEYIVSSSLPDEKVFVWGDSSTIYALSRRLPPGRYVADYHIKDFSSEIETLKVLKQNPPKLIVVLQDSPAFPALTVFLRQNYILIEELDGSEIWSLLNPRVRALISG